MTAQRSFTLLELLVVVAILSVIAGGVVVSLQSDVESTVGDSLARTELVELKKAVLRFHTDTGFLPRQGPFALDTGPNTGVVALTSDPQAAAWFASPANWSQLLENPLAPSVLYGAYLATPTSTTHFLRERNLDTGRGWNGPYLPREGTVDVGAGTDLAGDGGAALIPDVPGIADPYERPPTALGYLRWHSIGGAPLERAGRPILLLVDSLEPASLSKAKLVSLGPDGLLGTPDDLEVALQ